MGTNTPNLLQNTNENANSSNWQTEKGNAKRDKLPYLPLQYVTGNM